MKNNNIELTAIPKIAKKRIQLYNIYKEVILLGGYDIICSQDLWGQVASQLNLPPIADVINVLHSIYKDNLLAFEKSPDRFEIPTKKEPSNAPSKAGMRAVKAGMQCVTAPKMGMQSVTAPSEEQLQNVKNEITDINNNDNDNDEKDNEEEESFGFATGRVYSLSTFKNQANRFYRNWFQITNNASPPKITHAQIESEYWNIVENSKDPVRVHYGSDLDVKSHGSGFSPNDPNPWNLTVLPTLPRSLLRFLPEHVSGITIPMMYVGMVFSTFCWHVEDDYLYSINYLHEGAPKTWYGVGSQYSTQFERVMKDTFPDLFEVQPDLLHHLTTMLSPLDFIEAGVPICKAQQNVGEFMITFPQAYHGGFNNGFNVAEAVNFATPDWLPFGELVIKNYQLVKRTHIFSNIELIVNALQFEENPYIITWFVLFFLFLNLFLCNIFRLLKAFHSAREKEKLSISKISSLNMNQQVWPTCGPLPYSKACKMCNTECYLSTVICSCGAYSCLDHFQEISFFFFLLFFIYLFF